MTTPTNRRWLIVAVLAASVCIAVNTLSLALFLAYPNGGEYARLYSLTCIVPYYLAAWVLVSAALKSSVAKNVRGWRPEPRMPWLMLLVIGFAIWLLGNGTSWFTSGPAQYAGPLVFLALSLGMYGGTAYTAAMTNWAAANDQHAVGPAPTE